jgi:hypothetical protein
MPGRSISGLVEYVSSFIGLAYKWVRRQGMYYTHEGVMYLKLLQIYKCLKI